MKGNFVTNQRLTRGRGRPRKHSSNASKQAAYRANKAKREPLKNGQVVELPVGTCGVAYWSKNGRTLVARGCTDGKSRYWQEVDTSSLTPLPYRTNGRWIDPNIPMRALKRPTIPFGVMPLDRDRALGSFYGIPTRRVKQKHIDAVVGKLVFGAKKK